MAKTVFIYCLKDPTTGDVRYIGKTDDLKVRLQRHISESSKFKSHLGSWLRSLGADKPILAVLHKVAEHESWQEEEKRYICFARGMGMDLVNIAEGGAGGSGPCSPEQCAARSAARKGKPWSPAQRAASDAKNGMPLSPAASAAYAAKSAALRGVPWSPAQRAARDVTKGLPMSSKQRAGHAANSAALKGVPWSPARRAAYEAGKLAK